MSIEQCNDLRVFIVDRPTSEVGRSERLAAGRLDAAGRAVDRLENALIRPPAPAV